MFFFKKFISQFLFPLPLCLMIIFLGLCLLWFSRKQRTGKILATIGAASLFLFSHSFMSDLILTPLEKKHGPYIQQFFNEPVDPAGSLKYIVVLGSGHTSDPKLPITSQLNDTGVVRLIEGIRMYRMHPGSKLLLSGGGAFNPVPNAVVMANLASAMGIPDKDMIIEPNSKDTKDEAKLIRPIVGVEPFGLVTSASHMPRAVALFEKLGMNPIPIPTRHRVRKPTGSLSFDRFFPCAVDLRKSERAVYEYLGIAWSKLRSLI